MSTQRRSEDTYSRRGARGARIWTRHRLNVEDIPPILYRVHHRRAHTVLLGDGFKPLIPGSSLHHFGDARLVDLFNDAFDKTNGQPSLFVQLYTDYHVANRFAHSLEEASPEDAVEIWVVDGVKFADSGAVCFLASTLERYVMGIQRESIESRRGEVLLVAGGLGVPSACLRECIRADDPRRAKRQGWEEEVAEEDEAEEYRDFNREVDEILREQEESGNKAARWLQEQEE